MNAIMVWWPCFRTIRTLYEDVDGPYNDGRAYFDTDLSLSHSHQIQQETY